MVAFSAAGTLVCRVDVLMRRIPSWSCEGQLILFVGKNMLISPNGSGEILFPTVQLPDISVLTLSMHYSPQINCCPEWNLKKFIRFHLKFGINYQMK
jgi:hypothetical protein